MSIVRGLKQFINSITRADKMIATKNYLKNFDPKYLRVIRTIGREADRLGLSVYIVGGVVRDILLGLTVLDLDITVEGDAIKLAKVLSGKWKCRLVIYKQFGTACLDLPDKTRIDLAGILCSHS